MDLTALGGYNLWNLDRQNIVLGKNGCGKSHLLKRLEQALVGKADIGALRYISPERAGMLQYEPGVEQALTSSPSSMAAA